MASNRVKATERPYIDDVLHQYADIPNLVNLALGSSHWGPPVSALNIAKEEIFTREVHRYGDMLGLDTLRHRLLELLKARGLNPEGCDIMITAGANQGFNAAIQATCDSKDKALMITPYFYCQRMSMELCEVDVEICPFQPSTLLPDWDNLSSMISTIKPRVVVITTPNNPSGKVWSEQDLRRLIEMCRAADAWLIADQTYHEILFDREQHIFPCSRRFGYDKIIHVFSMSKVFGVAGWRVGYAVFPQFLLDSMRKVQDCITINVTIISQKLVLHCLDTYEGNKNAWIEERVRELATVRETLWPIVAKMNVIKTTGTFYYLIPVPPMVGEYEAVDILARQFGLLLMHGTPFGAPGYLRLSYGGIPPQQVMGAADQLQRGLDCLLELSAQRVAGAPMSTTTATTTALD